MDGRWPLQPLYHTLLVVVSLCLAMACSRKAAQLPEAGGTLPFPEVRHLTIQGNTAFGDAELRKAMVTRQRPPLLPWRQGEPYNPPTLEADLRRLKKHYFDHGFLDTVVRLGSVQENDARNTVSVEIVIEEGAPTLVQAVRLDGVIPPEFPAIRQLIQALPLQAGQPITKAAFDQSKALLLTRLHDAGYARAQVTPYTAVDPVAHQATVTFTLEPGTPTTFGRITITGAQQVSERAIRRKISIREGQLYSAKRLTESADDVYGLGMFQAVSPRAQNFDDVDTPLDIDFEVRERKPRTVQIGVGFSTVERFRLLVEWTHRNVFGGAQRFSVTGKVSSIEQRLETRLFLPYFLGRRNSLTQSFFIRNEEEVSTDPSGISNAVFPSDKAQPAFDLFSVGSETRLGRQFTRTLSGSTGIQVSLNNFRNVNAQALEEADISAEIAEDNLLLVHFAEVLWNTSDSLLNPTRGILLRGRIEHANTAVVSDVSFVKLLFEARHYQPLWGRTLLATRLVVGSIEPYGRSTEVPFNVRFFAGGSGSVRGFSLNRLGPLDADGDPIGGHSLFEGNVEVRFPILGSFSGAAFIDFGNVFRESFTYQLGDLRYAIGPGLRLNTPVGPLRLDVGFVVARQPGEGFGRVEFSIGQAF